MNEFWKLMLSAQECNGSIPKQLIEDSRVELTLKKSRLIEERNKKKFKGLENMQPSKIIPVIPEMPKTPVDEQLEFLRRENLNQQAENFTRKKKHKKRKVSYSSSSSSSSSRSRSNSSVKSRKRSAHRRKTKSPKYGDFHRFNKDSLKGDPALKKHKEKNPKSPVIIQMPDLPNLGNILEGQPAFPEAKEDNIPLYFAKMPPVQKKRYENIEQNAQKLKQKSIEAIKLYTAKKFQI